MFEKIHLSLNIPESYHGMRLDAALAQLMPEYSRARLQAWIKNGEITVNGARMRGKDKIKGTETVVVNATLTAEIDWQGQDIAIDILYEDEDLIVVNKQANLVVHPAAGQPDGTLVNALLHHCPSLEQIPRAGIIHRLDKDTTGCLVIAKTLTAHTSLVQQLQARTMHRHYLAIVNGVLTGGGTVDKPIARHPKQRTKMAVVANGKPAVTHYRIKERFRAHTYLDLQLETGRTHQIRVHMTSIKHPILGDPTYGGRPTLPPKADSILIETISQFNRQALHARRLNLEHPARKEIMEWTAPVPDDMQVLIDLLQQDLIETKNQ